MQTLLYWAYSMVSGRRGLLPAHDWFTVVAGG